MKLVHALIVTAASCVLTAALFAFGYPRRPPAPVAEALPSQADATAPAPPGISGQVVDAGGHPVSGAVVVAREIADSPELVPVGDRPIDPTRDGVVSDERGNFSISRLPPGRYVLVAIHGQHSPGRSDPVVVAPGGGESAVVVVLGSESILI